MPQCPLCSREDREKLERLRQELDDDYGKVSVHEYKRREIAIIEAEKLADSEYPESFTEWSLCGVQGVLVYLTYHGRCSRCSHDLRLSAKFDAITGAAITETPK